MVNDEVKSGEGLEERFPALANVTEQEHEQAIDTYREVLERLQGELDENRG